jgi:hypothetical protein
VLHRWTRLAAFALPMTSEGMTHGACSVQRRGDRLYLVFVYAQLNDPSVLEDLERREEEAFGAWEGADALARPAALRALGAWRNERVARIATRLRKADDADIAAAAWDVGLMLEESATRSELERRRTSFLQPNGALETSASARSFASWVARLRNAPDLASWARAALEDGADGPPGPGAGKGTEPEHR